MRKLMTVCVALLIFGGIHAGDKKTRARGVSQWAESAPAVKEVAKSEPQTFEERPSLMAKSTNTVKSSGNAALDEVNAKRVQRGMTPLIYDEALTQAAQEAARRRASRGIAGHLPESDFSCLPAGTPHDCVAGCAALDSSWGWQSCAWDEPQYTHAGAAIVESGGLRYMHIFCRNGAASKESAPVASSPVTTYEGGSCANGSCGTQSFSRRGRR